MADKGSNRGNGNHVSVDSTTRVIIQEQNRDLFNEILKSYIRNKPLGPYEMGIVESFGNIIIGEEYKDIALLNGRYTNFENLLTKQVPTEIGEAIEIPLVSVPGADTGSIDELLPRFILEQKKMHKDALKDGVYDNQRITLIALEPVGYEIEGERHEFYRRENEKETVIGRDFFVRMRAIMQLNEEKKVTFDPTVKVVRTSYRDYDIVDKGLKETVKSPYYEATMGELLFYRDRIENAEVSGKKYQILILAENEKGEMDAFTYDKYIARLKTEVGGKFSYNLPVKAFLHEKGSMPQDVEILIRSAGYGAGNSAETRPKETKARTRELQLT